MLDVTFPGKALEGRLKGPRLFEGGVFMDAAILHNQHQALFRKVRNLTDALQQEPLPAQELADHVRMLGMELKQHFDGEREGLYGLLLKDPDPTTRALAGICHVEALAAERALDIFLRRWTVPLHISRDPETFRREAHKLFARIGRRTGLEERELMPRLVQPVA